MNVIYLLGSVVSGEEGISGVDKKYSTPTERGLIITPIKM